MVRRLWSPAAVAGACVGALAVGLSGGAAAHGAAAVVPGIVDVNTNLVYEDAAAAGTGIVLSSSGEILTNNHVIQGATTVHVTDIDNGHTYTATVVGYDITADVAVLQLKGATGLETAPLGNSATAKVGEAITSIGNAGGVGGTPSSVKGTISALDQSLTAGDEMTGGTEQLSGMIETNAALQPGDSGGPMVNSHDQVIGIDTAGGTEAFAFQQQTSQGFAIPINRALALARQIEAGHATKDVHVGETPFLGVGVAEVDISEQFQVTPGLLVTGVVAGMPAAKAGLEAEDVITSLDGHAVTTPTDLTDLLLAKAPGDTVTLGWVDPTGATHSSHVRLASGPPQ